jgi:hypothetical protein
VDGGIEDTHASDGVVAPELRTITLRNLAARDMPPAGILILVHSAAGAHLASGLSNAQGQVHMAVPPGSTVTAIVENSSRVGTFPVHTMVSLFAVPDVDSLHMDISKVMAQAEPTPVVSEYVDMQVDLLSTLAGAEGDTGTLQFGCSSPYTAYDDNTSTTFIGYYVGSRQPCVGRNDIEVWGFARGGWGYETFSIASVDPRAVKHIAVMANNTAWDTSSLFVEGIPPGTGHLSYAVKAALSAGNVGFSGSEMVKDPPTEQMLQVKVPRAAFHHVSSASSMLVSEDPYVEASVAREGLAAADLHWNVSQDLALFEYLSEVDRTISNRPGATVHTTATGNLGDFTEVKFNWQNVRWTAYLPPQRQLTVQLPDLPPGPDRFAPGPADEVYLDVGARMIDDLAIEGYAAFVSSPYDPSKNLNRTDVR